MSPESPQRTDSPKRKLRSVACPGSFLGKPHDCQYDLSTGVWACKKCGLAGEVEGYCLLYDLEAERHALKVELEIMEFEHRAGVKTWTR